jgi:hypothetical protein
MPSLVEMRFYMSGQMVKDFLDDKDSLTNRDGETVAVAISIAVLKSTSMPDSQMIKCLY